MRKMCGKRLLAICLAASVLTAPCAGFAQEADSGDYWFLQGYADGELHLEQSLTRAEFAKMVVTAFALEETEDKGFPDLDVSHWSYPYVMKAVKAGIIHGYEDGTFRPEELVTFEEAAKMLSGLFRWNLRLADGVAAAIEYGITDGITAMIGDTLTRGEAAEMVSNALQAKEEQEENWIFGSGGGVASSGGISGASPAVSRETTSANENTYGGSTPSMNNEESDSAAAGGSNSGAAGGGSPAFVMRPEYVISNEEYAETEENIFKDVSTSPLSTFSIDTDTASYSNMRRFVLQGQIPQSGSIRTEELINYFDYNYPEPEEGQVFGISTEVGSCPWNEENQLVKIAIQGEEMKAEERQPSNLVFLIDVSGSMASRNKLPLVKRAMKMLVDTLDERDHISIVTYASGVQVVLDSTNASEKETLYTAIDRLAPGGGTNGGDGLKMAYEQAEKNRIIEGNNRVIICSDGDFNIGLTTQGELTDLIEEEREKRIFISTLGFGMYNYKDTTMELLADKGNGNYAYIDNLKEAKKVLVDEMAQTLYTIAKDVKIQVEFNPEKIKAYRLIGYENRMLQTEDFANDQKDAGELGAGANVTALYEIVPADGTENSTLRYTETTSLGSDELLCINLRYKEPAGDESKLIEYPVNKEIATSMSEDFYFTAALAELGMLLNASQYVGTSSYASILEMAQRGCGNDPYGLKRECIQLVDLLQYITFEHQE